MLEAILTKDDFSPFDDKDARPPEVLCEGDLEQLDAEEDDPATLKSFLHGNGRFEYSNEGVFFVAGEKRTRVSDELRILAETRDARGNNWGRWLSWKDGDGNPHSWKMPIELLQGDQLEVVKTLAAQGLRFAYDARKLLCEYIQVCPVEKRVRCVDRLGWHKGAYCTPSETIGPQDEEIVFQSAVAIPISHSQQGTVSEWRSEVALLARGNSRLQFAICCAFAGPLLEISGLESGGFHFVGASATGKTTALHVAASVWGPPEHYVRSWRATANGLEGHAAIHNDGVLILDELSQCDPREVGSVVYMLGNGSGKIRAGRLGNAREVTGWRLLFLSSGEVSPSVLMAEAGRRTNAGQEIRLANVPADAGAGRGMFEDLSGCESPAVLAQILKDRCAKFYGAVGLEFLRSVASERPALVGNLALFLRDFVSTVVPSNASSQVERVARRFGLVAYAGELATSYRLTGWEEGDSSDAAEQCFKNWLEDFGLGSHEEKAVCQQVRLFIEANGSSRFQSMERSADQVHNRAGFWREAAGVREYLIPAATFKTEIISGFEAKSAVKSLVGKGMLLKHHDGKPYIKERLPNLGPTNVYIVVIPEETLE